MGISLPVGIAVPDSDAIRYKAVISFCGRIAMPPALPL